MTDFFDGEPDDALMRWLRRASQEFDLMVGESLDVPKALLSVKSEARRRLAEWLSAAANGDHEAWKRIVDDHCQAVWSASRGLGLSASDAADVTQTTWLILVENLGGMADRMANHGCLDEWLTATTHRIALDTAGWHGGALPVDIEVESVPDDVVRAAYTAVEWRDLDTEIAELWHVEGVEGAAVRRKRDDDRPLAFTAGEVTLIVELSDVEGRRGLNGQVIPTDIRGEVRIDRPAGSTTVPVEGPGLFTVDSVPPGPVRFALIVDGRPSFVTTWITV